MTFLYEAILGGSSGTPTSTAFCGPDVDDNNNISKRRCLKQFVKTKIGDKVQIGLCNLTSKVEGEVSMNYSDDEQVLGDDEMTNSYGIDREEAPCDGDVVMPGVVTLNVSIPSVILRSRCHSRDS
jgi:hypothetical protein